MWCIFEPATQLNWRRSTPLCWWDCGFCQFRIKIFGFVRLLGLERKCIRRGWTSWGGIGKLYKHSPSRCRWRTGRCSGKINNCLWTWTFGGGRERAWGDRCGGSRFWWGARWSGYWGTLGVILVIRDSSNAVSRFSEGTPYTWWSLSYR